MSILKKIDKDLIGYVIGVGILFFFFIFLLMCAQIGYSVKTTCLMAQNQYGGRCVDALTKQIEDSSTNQGKNTAIWALGQLGDKSALLFLEKYDNKQPLPKKEKWDEGISQYELRKAIKLLKSDFNLSAFIWR